MECENICLDRSSKFGRSCASVSILVVDDDTTCLAFVAALLKKFKYEVVTAKHPNDALCALRIKGGAFDLVVSDIHMPDMNGFQLQEAITHEFNLPVILMSVDNKEGVVSKGMKSGAALFISKPVSPNDFKDLWQFVAMRKKSPVVIKEANSYFPQKITVNNKENSKRKPQSKEGFESDVNTKKPKVIWTNALHYRFLEAIRSIGLERSVPKKILEAMNVPGLTRENVASHLQKYRMFLKRVSDASYKLDEVGDEDESLIRRSYASNYSLNRLNKHRFQFESFPASHEKAPSLHSSDASILGSININPRNSEIISALSSTHPMRQKSENCVNFHSNELQNNIDQPCYVPNRQHLSQDELPPLPPSSNLPLIQDLQIDGGPFCSVYDLPAFHMIASHVQQPFNLNPTHLHNNQLINIKDQEQPHGCEYAESSLLYDGINNSSYDQAVYQQQIQGSTDSVEIGSVTSQFNKAFESPNECDDDAALESLLAFGLFGDDQFQTLEGL